MTPDATTDVERASGDAAIAGAILMLRGNPSQADS